MATSEDDIAWLQMFSDLSRSDVGLQAQIRQLLMAAILQGHLSAGRRLPSTRRLAAMLGIARNTVSSAYEQLVEEGLLLSHERSGLVVASAGIARPAQRGPVVQPGSAALAASARHAGFGAAPHQ